MNRRILIAAMALMLSASTFAAEYGSINIVVSGDLPNPIQVTSLTLEIKSCENDATSVTILGTDQWQPYDSTRDFRWYDTPTCPITIKLDDNREAGHFVADASCTVTPDTKVTCPVKIVRLK